MWSSAASANTSLLSSLCKAEKHLHADPKPVQIREVSQLCSVAGERSSSMNSLNLFKPLKPRSHQPPALLFFPCASHRRPCCALRTSLHLCFQLPCTRRRVVGGGRPGDMDVRLILFLRHAAAANGSKGGVKMVPNQKGRVCQRQCKNHNTAKGGMSWPNQAPLEPRAAITRREVG